VDLAPLPSLSTIWCSVQVHQPLPIMSKLLIV